MTDTQTPTQKADAEFDRLSGVYHSVIGRFVDPGQSFALMDFPAHNNVGDSAIWSGEMAFFDKHVGRPASFVNTCGDDPADVANYVPEGPVFIHGGGNFGDIWDNHQRFRLLALERLKGRPLVQLPQSIHFNSDKEIEKMARAIEAHGQFTLIVRDQHSSDFAQKHFNCEVLMSPDAAVNIKRIHAPAPTVPVISFLREDKESVWGDAAPFLKTQGVVTDWPDINVWALSDRIARKFWRLSTATTKQAMANQERMFRKHAAARVSAGVQHMSSGQIIVNDRLHVHLISSLIRRPHLVMDNAYGKIARHIGAWGDFGLARPVKDMDELKRTLEQSLNALG